MYCLFPIPYSSAQTDAGGRWLLIISYTVDYQFDYLTALLEYLDLEGARLSSLFS